MPAVVVEEPLVPDVERLSEQLASAGQARNSTRRGGQHHKGVRIARLLVRTLASGVDASQPAAARVVPQPAGQAGQTPGRQDQPSPDRPSRWPSAYT